MKITLTRSFAALFLAAGMATAVFGQPAATCEQACTKYKKCTIEIWTNAGKTMGADDQSKLYPGCMKTCKSAKYKEQTMACYKQSLAATTNTCQTYATCVINASKKTQ